MRLVLGLVVSLALGVPASQATIFGGGGSGSIDCLTVFDAPVNFPPTAPRSVRCTDGDPACDADGSANGRCEFVVGMCLNSTVDPRCTLNGVNSVEVDHAQDDGIDPRFDPDFQALQQRVDDLLDAPPNTDPDACATTATILLPVQGPIAGACRRSRKQIMVTTLSRPIAGRIYRDIDRLKLSCEPAEGVCSAMAFFTDTFDRIQRQIFNQGCAVATCHDSQSQQQNLLLETGSSHGNLVNVSPTTLDALAAGWERVTVTGPTSGDPVTSFLYRKVTGDLPSSLGDLGQRMPRGRAKLKQELIDVIRLWIEAGAPASGWVPGTF